MAALNRPTQATYEIHESVKVDTSGKMRALGTSWPSIASWRQLIDIHNEHFFLGSNLLYAFFLTVSFSLTFSWTSLSHRIRRQ
jgi:hypothetical protein